MNTTREEAKMKQSRFLIVVILSVLLCACTQNTPPVVSTQALKAPTRISWGDVKVPEIQQATPTIQPDVLTALTPEKDFFLRGDAVYVHLRMDNLYQKDVAFTATVLIDGKGQAISGVVSGGKNEDFSIGIDIPTTLTADYLVVIEISDGDATFQPTHLQTVIRIR